MHSDNGTNFIGANCELMKSFKQMSKSRDVGSYMATSFINWHLIPPGAPHFGGIWESAVKATKFHLRRVLGETRLTYEEFATLLCEIEAQLNSRPLTVLYDDDVDNINVLTPGHFLIGQPLVQVAEPGLEHVQMNRISRWQLLTRLQQEFWHRWQREYLTTLQQRAKWYKEKQNLKPGAVVLVYEERAPPSCWQMGRVTDVHPGKDNLVRVATIKTSHGSIKRPVTKLCKLPTEG
ncbi:uncharacterized protein LOC118755562 [Rhagoletis pomonella]|uniref:uncharacterized protein LOC118755562 n=1 Tax=Rhagoletis pomonella TaxID=28610 RepID=UPI00177EE708|nr:uncharacterized protein LOC118755562 [Rhagoletis pomonella]